MVPEKYEEYKLKGFRVYRAPLDQPNNWTLMKVVKDNKKSMQITYQDKMKKPEFVKDILYARFQMTSSPVSIYRDYDMDFSKSYIYKFVPVDEFVEERPEAAIEGVYAPE